MLHSACVYSKENKAKKNKSNMSQGPVLYCTALQYNCIFLRPIITFFFFNFSLLYKDFTSVQHYSTLLHQTLITKVPAVLKSAWHEKMVHLAQNIFRASKSCRHADTRLQTFFKNLHNRHLQKLFAFFFLIFYVFMAF